MKVLRQPPRYASLGAAIAIAIAAALLLLLHQGPGGVVSPASAAVCDADAGPAIVTDRVEYLPTEVAIVSGCGFEAYNGQALTLKITEPDSVVFTDNVTIQNGGFAYSYVVPDKQGTYTVEALSGTTVLASTTFLDSYYVDPTSLTFVVEQGSDPASQTFSVVVPTKCDDAGGTITDNRSWITTAGSWPQSAWQSGPGSNVHVDLAVNISSNSLALGIYTGTVTVDLLDGSSGCGGTKNVAITLYVVQPNPVLTSSCGLDVALVMDSSGSVDNSELSQMKSAFQSFVSAFLPDTPTQMSVIDFDTSASVLQGFTNNTSLLNSAINSPTSGGWTNWDDALHDSRLLFPNRASAPDLIILASDGNPTQWGGHDGDPLTTDSGGTTALPKAIAEANAAKAAGIRVITLGIGNDLTTANLAAISSWDAVYTSDFSTLATTLGDLAVELCGGTVTAKKVLDLDNNLATTGDQIPGESWTMSVNVDAPDTATPTSGLTDNNGQINFDIDVGNDATATLAVTETQQTGYVFMSANCKKGGNPIGTPGTGTVTGVVIGPQDIVSCTFYNLPQRTFTVNKDFVPNNGASVSVSLSCASGTTSPASASVTESTPGVFTVTGYTGTPNCTATESPIPSGYASTGTCTAALTAGSCTITNTLRSGTFTISKDFVPNSGNSVPVSVSCTSGTPSPASGSFSEASPLVVTVTGFNAGATCTATETVPSGYTANQAPCAGVALVNGGNASCTITNTLNAGTFIVNKDFVPNNAASVSVSVSCTSGTPSPASGTASESTPFMTTISGYSGNPTCTATESPIPSGYSSSGTCNALLSVGQCTITNTLNSATLTVYKDFVPNNAATVSVSVTCTNGGTPSPASGSSSEATPFVTTVTGFTAGATCTATETVPSGYTASQAGCASVAISPSGSHSCTIVNTLNSQAFIVNKDFVPNNGASVSVSISCTSGTPTPASGTASEATPFNTVVTGYSGNPTCTATESPIPTGYSSSGTCAATLSIGSCTITNTQNSATFTVVKDFVPNNGASVSVSVSCTSGTPSPASGSASEASPFVTTVTGYSAGATCTATETIPSGYTSTGTCSGAITGAPSGTGTCTIVNNLKSGTFTVNKDFLPNNAALVAVSVTCTSGTPSPSSGSASEGTPFVTTVTGFAAGATCTATEMVPSGYTANQADCAAKTIVDGGNVTCTITNTLNSATLTVNKDFVPNDGASVSVSVTCTNGGAPSPASGTASEATPFVTTITGFTAGATCTATESPVPTGYTANQAGCASVAISVGGTPSCTIINTQTSATLTVSKDFVPNNGATVPVSVSCTSGTPSPASGTFSEASPFVTTITGFTAGTTCTATETEPTGYTASQAACAGVAISNGGAASCTITNTLNSATLTVNKDFVPNDGASVSVSVTCSSGTPSPASGSASEATPFVTTITGFSAGATCTATESPVPAGYTANQSNCLNVAITNGAGSSCTIVNTLKSGTFTVNKDFLPNDGASVSVTVSCTSGTPSPASGSASEATPFVTTVTGFLAGATCTATETVPAGYTANQAACAGVALTNGGNVTCTITNTLNSATLTVNKDFVPNDGAPVSVSVTCTSGTPSPASGSASEATPFVTTITGFSTGATCTATETVPAGHTANQSGCASVAILVGGTPTCTIVNTLNSATLTVNKDFQPNDGASVPVSVTCTSGTPSPASGSFSEASPFVTTITGFSAGATCTATETVPGGYTANQVPCAAVAIAVGGSHTCTITNTLNSNTFTVNKDFAPNSGASVSVSVSCASGTPSPASGSSSETTPFVTTISGFSGDPLCTATESPVPAGYTSSGTCSATLSAGSCTITNTLNTATLTVNKDFLPNSGASVSVSVTCTSGTPSPASGSASEATPFVTTISGFSAGATCTATETVPGGYTADQSGCASVAIPVGGTPSCTITNTLNSATLTVNKDFVPNSGASVSVSVTCTNGGTPSPASGSASEATPFVTTVTGFTSGATCTATETEPGGYTKDESNCLNVAISVGGTPSCTIVNNLNSSPFFVNKDFIPNSGASVTVSVSCTSGTPTPASGTATEAIPFAFTLNGYVGDPTCTATESPIPTGYSSTGTCSALLSAGSCTIVNQLNDATLTVNKDFLPNSGASVSVSVTCTSGTPSPASGTASETTPFVTYIAGFSIGATCTATETVPSGYTANQSNCASVALAVGGTPSCTITNTLNSATLTVNKNFVPDNAATVSVSVTCTNGGTPSPASGSASEGSPFVTTVTGFTAGATCTATETEPSGYTKDESGCANVAIPVGGTPSCTIVNNQNTGIFTVNKDFQPNSGASVSVSVTCTSGTPSPASGSASEATPLTVTVTGFTPGASCTGTESPVPAGYTSSGTCTATIAAGSCTIVNTLIQQTFTVQKDFVPNSGASVTVSLSCASGTVSPSSASATEATPASFTVSGPVGDPNCVATESPIPAGYNSSGTCNATLSAGTCTIVNTLRSATLTVNKDFVPNNAASVAVSVTCTSGTASPASGSASEATPFVTTITGFNVGATCTATETVPGGYDANQANCANVAITDGGSATCTITNTPSALFVVHKDFTDNNPASVTVTLSCTEGTPTPASAPAAEGSPASFIVSGASGSAVCTATETGVPAGYTVSSCQGLMSTGSCTIVNQAVATFTVSKDFVPNNPASVTVVLTCTPPAVVSPPSASISEGAPWGFTVTGYTPATTCTATESPVPAGYIASGCQNVAIVNHLGSCTVTNTQATPSPTPSPTVGGASVTPTPFGQTPNTAVGGAVVLPVVRSDGEGGGSSLGLALMALIGVAAVASMGGAWKLSRRNRG